jgi:hypothetical protein
MSAAYVNPSLHLVQVAGKGEGYRAAAAIVAGQLLIREQVHTARSSSSQYDKVCAAIELANTLSKTYPSNIAKLVCSGEQIEMTLSYIDDLAQDVPLIGRMTDQEQSWLAGSAARVQNNSFERMDGGGVTQMLLGFAMAKVNHSCNPNSSFAPTLRVNELILVASRAIRPGEEITLSYIQGERVLTAQERRNRLFKRWGFWCTCELSVALNSDGR